MSYGYPSKKIPTHEEENASQNQHFSNCRMPLNLYFYFNGLSYCNIVLVGISKYIFDQSINKICLNITNHDK